MKRPERWKFIPGYEGIYSVSTMGRVRRDGKCYGATVGKILKPQNVRGYYAVDLCKNSNKKKIMIAKIITYTFLGERPKGYHVNHKDCNKLNNQLSNLEYVSPSENIRHAYKNNLINTKGETHHSAKLKEKEILQIRNFYLNKNFSRKQLAEMYKVTYRNIYSITTNHSWRHTK